MSTVDAAHCLNIVKVSKHWWVGFHLRQICLLPEFESDGLEVHGILHLRVYPARFAREIVQFLPSLKKATGLWDHPES